MMNEYHINDPTVFEEEMLGNESTTSDVEEFEEENNEQDNQYVEELVDLLSDINN